MEFLESYERQCCVDAVAGRYSERAFEHSVPVAGVAECTGKTHGIYQGQLVASSPVHYSGFLYHLLPLSASESN